VQVRECMRVYSGFVFGCHLREAVGNCEVLKTSRNYTHQHHNCHACIEGNTTYTPLLHALQNASYNSYNPFVHLDLMLVAR